jgi:hypothetical protein
MSRAAMKPKNSRAVTGVGSIGLVMPRWERGYRCHGYWLDNARVGRVFLGPRGFFDGDYGWELDGKGERGHAFSLRTAKRLVEQAYLRHNAGIQPSERSEDRLE